MNRVFITGIAGQDGAYSAKIFIEKGYEVYGTVLKNESLKNLKYLNIEEKLNIEICDITDYSKIEKIVKVIKPNIFLNFAAISFPAGSYNMLEKVFEINEKAVFKLLNIIFLVNKNIRFLQASSAEIFANAKESPQNENTPYSPVSPYGISKLGAQLWTDFFRKNRKMFACSAILYNHESVLKEEKFLMKKIISSVVRIKEGKQKKLVLGNIKAGRDWGYAPEYCEAMYKIVTAQKPDNYIVASGTYLTVETILKEAFNYFNLNYKDYYEVSKEFYREETKVKRIGNIEKINKNLEWQPNIKGKKLVVKLIEDELDFQRKRSFI